MKIICPHCSQTLELEPEVLDALQGQSHFACPMCEGQMAVPEMQVADAPEKQAGVPGGKAAAEATQPRVQISTAKKSKRFLVIAGVGVLLAITAGVLLFGGRSTIQPFVNTLGMKFVPVPGTNVMFCIHETRYRDYAAFAAEKPGLRASWKNQSYDGFAPTERPQDHPVVLVSWEEAVAFCGWLSQKEGKTYRLPTDREWSIAVAGGLGEQSPPASTAQTESEIKSVFPWEGQWPPPKGAANYADSTLRDQFPKYQIIEGYTDGFPTTAPVMSFTPNSLGLYDLAGNVREWMGDWPNAGQENNRLHRGGGWGSYDRAGLSSSRRARNQAFSRTNDRGFRIVLELGDGAAKSPKS